MDRGIKQLLQTVLRRMADENVTQRALASVLRISQGHLSKMLRGQQMHHSRAMRSLADWAEAKGRLPGGMQALLVQEAQAAGAGSDDAARLVIEMLRAVRKLRDAR